jgi:hypothetical protein
MRNHAGEQKGIHAPRPMRLGKIQKPTASRLRHAGGDDGPLTGVGGEELTIPELSGTYTVGSMNPYSSSRTWCTPRFGRTRRLPVRPIPIKVGIVDQRRQGGRDWRLLMQGKKCGYAVRSPGKPGEQGVGCQPETRRAIRFQKQSQGVGTGANKRMSSTIEQ